MTKSRFGFLILLALVAASCSSPKEESVKPSYQKVYLGDVMNLLVGVENQPRIDLAFFQTLQDEEVYFIGSTEFKSMDQYDTRVESDRKTMQSKNQSSPEQSHQIDKYKIEISPNDKVLKIVSNPRADIEVGFYSMRSTVPLKKNSPLMGLPMYVKVDQKITEALLVHASVSPDKNVFSFMTLSPSDDGDELSVFYFTKKIKKAVIVEPKYPYSFGPGVKMGWDVSKRLDIDLCGRNVNMQMVQEFTSAIQEWISVKNLPKNVHVNVRRDLILPFNDLSQHCIFVVDDYQYNPSPHEAYYGATVTIPNFESHKFIDADIIIFNREAQKIGVSSIWDSEFEMKRKYTFLHELGHFFGLSHQFDDSIPSIMSYKFEAEHLTPYDREAITKLYE